MAPVKPDWTPEIGEMVFILPEISIPEGFKNEVPDKVTGHFPLVMHITPGEDAKNRYVWFFVLHSTEDGSAEESQKVHFQYNHVGKDGKRVAGHAAAACSSECKKLLFLKPTGVADTKMNKAGWVDIGNLFELPLACMRPKPGDRWILRDCSVGLIAERAKELIANRVSRWQPRCEGQLLCQKLDHSLLQIDDLVCWVEPNSKKSVDCNGTSYTACGPCVVVGNDLGKAKIHVLLDKRKSDQDFTRFDEIRADSEIITVRVLALSSYDVSKFTRLTFSFPRGTHRRTSICDQFLVLEPAFDVPIDDLYELPSCYLPLGTKVCTQTISCVDDYAFLEKSRIAKCADTRSARDAERNRLEAEKAKIQRQRADGVEDYNKLLQKTETGLKKIKDTALGLLTTVGEERAKGVHDQAPDRVLDIVKWLENYLLICAAMACLKQEGALLRADDDEVESFEQKRRSDLAVSMDKVLAGSNGNPPEVQSSASLREAIGPTASQCDPFICLMNPSFWPTYEAFMPKETTSKEPVQSARENLEDAKSSSTDDSSVSPSCPFL